MTPEQERDFEALRINTQPPVDGVEEWMCNKCGIHWTAPADPTFDRTQEGSGWPVFCRNCTDAFTRLLTALTKPPNKEG